MATRRYSIFDKILSDAMRKGYGPRNSIAAAKWFRNETKKAASGTTANALMKESTRLKSRFEIGKMYFFYYDPKHKKTLPYYDKFPLIFPIGPAEGGFYGINMHYLPLNYRAVLMDALYSIANNFRFDPTTRLKISYDVLNKFGKFKYFRPCIKHYLTDHVQSKFLKIESVEWNIALFLPVEKFQKRSREYVWSQSRKLI